MRFLARVWILLLLLSGAALCVGYIPFRIWQLKIIENFGGYFIPIAALGVVTVVWWWRAGWWLISFFCLSLLLSGLSIHAPTLISFFRGRPDLGPLAQSRFVANQDASVGVVNPVWSAALLNVSSENSHPEEVYRLLRSMDVEVVALLETTKTQVDQLSGTFPFRLFVPQVEDVGLALLSKFPFTDVQTSLGEDVRPVIMASLNVRNGTPVPVVVFDALPPFSDEEVELSWLITRRLGTKLRHEVPEGIVFTDLNATPFSQSYRGFVYEARLKDVQWGRGLRNTGMARTWDMSRWWMRFAIDHVFTKGAIIVRGLQVFNIPGSDHRGFLAVFETPGAVGQGAVGQGNYPPAELASALSFSSR